MPPEEQDLLSRLDERLASMERRLEKIETSIQLSVLAEAKVALSLGIIENSRASERITKLEIWANYRDGALALLLLLVGAGRVYDAVAWMGAHP